MILFPYEPTRISPYLLSQATSFFYFHFYDPHPLMAAYVCYGKAQGTMMTM